MDEHTFGPTDALAWVARGEFTDVRYETAEGIAKITIDRPDVRNAFRPLTTAEMIRAFDLATSGSEATTGTSTSEASDA